MPVPVPVLIPKLTLLLRAAAFAALLIQAVQAAAPPDEPRPYGHVVGDLVERRAVLAQPVETAALPRRGRINAWLELREARLEGSRPQQLHLVYQIVNAPRQVATIELPALELGGNRIEPWPINVSALTGAEVLARAGLDEMQPDIAPARAPLAPTLLRLAITLVLLSAVSFALATTRWPQLAFWRRHAPFRRAWAELRRWPAADDDSAARRRVMARLHAAFDAAAGQAVFAERLQPLYAAQPGLHALHGEIERFFAHSRREFFAAAPDTAALPVGTLIELARRLAQAEAGR